MLRMVLAGKLLLVSSSPLVDSHVTLAVSFSFTITPYRRLLCPRHRRQLGLTWSLYVISRCGETMGLDLRERTYMCLGTLKYL